MAAWPAVRPRYFLLTETSHMQIPIVIGAALVGALLGAWFSSMVGSALPNSRLKQFRADDRREASCC